MFVCCECCVLSGRGLCDELITHPEESYRLWCVVVCDLETSRMRRPWPASGRSPQKKNYSPNGRRNHGTPLKRLLDTWGRNGSTSGPTPWQIYDDEDDDDFDLLLASRMRWAGYVARMGKDRVAHRVLVEKPEGKGPLGRPRRRWEDNIKMDLQKVGGGGRGDWMELAQDRDRWRALVGTVKDFRVP
jgi:hypothetical protein